MATKLLNLLSSVPDFHSPIVRGTYENWAVLRVPERIASNSINWSLMAIVVHQILIRIGNTAFMNRALLCRGIISNVLPLWKVDTQSSCGNESHTSLFSLAVVISSTLENIFLIWVGFSLKLRKICHLKTFLHGPLKNSAVA